MTTVAVVVVLAIPVAGLIGLLRLATLLQRRREATISRQIALTDAIHAALGPVIAPVVRRGRGGWVGVLPVPIGHPQIGLMVEIAQTSLGPDAEIVLVAREPARHGPRRPPAPAAVAA
jgi:hypothetical protein